MNEISQRHQKESKHSVQDSTAAGSFGFWELCPAAPRIFKSAQEPRRYISGALCTCSCSRVVPLAVHSTPTHPTLPSSLAIIFSVAYISYLIPDHIQAPLTAAPGSWKKRNTFVSRRSSTMELALTLALWVRAISALRSIPSLQFQGFGPHSDPGVCTSMGESGMLCLAVSGHLTLSVLDSIWTITPKCPLCMLREGDRYVELSKISYVLPPFISFLWTLLSQTISYKGGLASGMNLVKAWACSVRIPTRKLDSCHRILELVSAHL